MFEPFQLKINKDGTILCPQCGDRFLHILETTFTVKDFKLLALKKHRPKSSLIRLFHERDVLHWGLDSLERCRAGQKYSIKLHYVCENGCRGVLEIRHHKGNTYLLHKPEPKET